MKIKKRQILLTYYKSYDGALAQFTFDDILNEAEDNYIVSGLDLAKDLVKDLELKRYKIYELLIQGAIA